MVRARVGISRRQFLAVAKVIRSIAVGWLACPDSPSSQRVCGGMMRQDDGTQSLSPLLVGIPLDRSLIT